MKDSACFGFVREKLSILPLFPAPFKGKKLIVECIVNETFSKSSVLLCESCEIFCECFVMSSLLSLYWSQSKVHQLHFIPHKNGSDLYRPLIMYITYAALEIMKSNFCAKWWFLFELYCVKNCVSMNWMYFRSLLGNLSIIMLKV